MKSVVVFVLSVVLLSTAFAGVETVEIGKIQNAKALSGIVADPADSALPGVQVLEVASDWKTIVRTTTTDNNGKWSLSPVPGQKIYYLRFVKNEFNELRVRVKLNRNKGKELRFNLPIAT